MTQQSVCKQRIRPSPRFLAWHQSQGHPRKPTSARVRVKRHNPEPAHLLHYRRPVTWSLSQLTEPPATVRSTRTRTVDSSRHDATSDLKGLAARGCHRLTAVSVLFIQTNVHIGGEGSFRGENYYRQLGDRFVPR